MLAITPSSNAQAALRYFRENLAQADYYCENNKIVGKWHGKAADQLNLSGPIETKDFEALLFNTDPSTGSRLTARNSANRRPMYDFTFNAPKSVSIIQAITGDQDIIDAHSRAVKDAMLEVEASVQTQMGSGKNKHYLTTGNCLYAEFVHDTSRPLKTVVDGKKAFVPDPQLHSHCAMINATFCKEQNRFRALELGNVKAQGAYFESLYHSHLAQHLKEAGYAIERSGKRWEIAGIERGTIDKYSGRTLEIEKEAEKREIRSAKAKAALGRLTRNDKNTSVADNKLQTLWKDRLTDAEYDTIMKAKGSTPGGSSEGNSVQHITPEKSIDLSLEHFLERSSAVPERKVLAHAIDLTSGFIPVQDVKNELARRDDIIKAERRTVSYITTRSMLSEEERLIERAVKGKASRPALNPNYEIDNPILNEGQRAAIDRVLSSNDQITMISGDAGVGKTTSLIEVKKGIEAAGRRMFAFAPSADASRQVLRAKSFEQADTIAKLLRSEKMQDELRDNVLLVDEAGLVGVPTMNKLFSIAETQNARVILSGDSKQHSAVERGDATRILETKAGLDIARVNTIVRQRNAEKYREVISELAAGIGLKGDQDKRKDKVSAAFEKLDKTGQVIEIDDRQERQRRFANDYVEAVETTRDNVLAIAPTHRESREITTAIREQLKGAGLLAKYDRAFTNLRSRQYTESEKQLAQSYIKGDTVEFHQNAQGFKAGSQYAVSGFDNSGRVLVKKGNETSILPTDQHQSYQLYRSATIGFAEGDKIRITKNSRSMDGGDLFNGQTYSIEGFDEDGNIQLSNGRSLSKDSKHFDHGYVSTSHASQGRDARQVMIAQSTDSFGASNDKQFYVSISRGTESCRVYTDDKRALKQAVSRSGDRVSATEIAEQARTERSKYVQQIDHMTRVKDFYDTRIKPSIDQLKERHEQRRIERQMGSKDLGLER